MRYPIEKFRGLVSKDWVFCRDLDLEVGRSVRPSVRNQLFSRFTRRE